MNPIILASASVQRKKLLKMLGVKLKICPSRVKEVKRIKTTCAALVKHNALLKAQDIASRFKEGIVIGADTVVYSSGKTIIGKPRNFQEAKRILKILFTRPHWVYTGVAVLDIRTGKRVVDYEKTRIFMSHLSEEEIDRYHRKVHPFDKAGGFDMEGVGSIFIHRIEGCYTNVLGLPMAKLHKMLKKIGVSILSHRNFPPEADPPLVDKNEIPIPPLAGPDKHKFRCDPAEGGPKGDSARAKRVLIWSCLLLFNILGCATEYNLATRQEETLLYGTEKEIKIGEAVSRQIEAQYKIVTDVDANERVEQILDRIVAVCDRKDLVYFIKILDEDIMNAVSLPGGYLYVFKGLIDHAETDDELAGVIAHEVGHITAKHSIKRMQASYGALLAQILSTQANGNIAGGVGFALNSLFLEHSQQDEFQADRLSVKYLKKAGYNPEGIGGFLAKLQEEQEKAPVQPYSYWRTHPHLPQRIAVVNQEVSGKIEFKDYLNLIGNE